MSTPLSTTTHWLGLGHPAWPDPIHFHTLVAAEQWYRDHRGTHPEIRVARVITALIDITDHLDRAVPDTHGAP